MVPVTKSPPTRQRPDQGSASAWRLITPIGVLLAILAAVLISVVFYSADSMNRSAVERQKALADNALSLRLAQSLSELRSVAWWDEAVVKSRKAEFDAEWLDIEVGVFVTTSYSHDRILILDERDRPVYGFGGDARLSQIEMDGYTKAISPLVAQIRGGPNVSPRIADKTLIQAEREASKITDRIYGRGAAAVMEVNGKPMLVSLMAITPSIDMALNSPTPRLLVSMIDVNNTRFGEIGRSILMPDLSFAKSNDKRSGAYTLKSDNGRVLGALRWTPRDPGLALIDQILPLILILLAVTAAMILALFRRLLASTRTLAQGEQEAQRLANHDALTGLPNRRMLQTELKRFSEAAERGEGQLAIACVDVDRFKDINDTLGHHAGDQLICGLAARLRQSVKGSDFVARLGGDEFAVLRNCEEPGDADALLELIRTCFKAPFAVNGQLVEANASAGLTLSVPGRSFEDLMREADIALYEAKARGRGCEVRFETAMARKIEQRRTLEIDLRTAIARGELSVRYQPIVEAATGHITSVEALARWVSARHGEVPPDIFIPIAEEAGIMADLGRLVIERAVADSLKWPGLDTAINISAAQLRSVSILDDLVEAVERHGVDPTRITVEITESVLMAKDERTTRTLRDIKQHGFALALDDFGTGYSSLAYIRDFPFDRLKIDRSFVHGLENSERALAIIEAVANFGRILGKDVVAEGIETKQEMQAMQRAGCTHLQGYLFSAPLLADHVAAMAAVRRRGAGEGQDDNVAQRSIGKPGAKKQAR